MKTEQNKEYPRHYSENDIKIIAFIESWLAKNEVSQSRLCRISVVNAATMSQVLAGKYPSSPSSFLQKAYEAIRNTNNASAINTAMPNVKTGIFLLATAACTHAKVFKDIAVVSAWVGTGKTHALKNFRDTNPNVFLIEVIKPMRVSSFVDELSEQVFGSEQKGSTQKKIQRLIKKLKDSDSLLILDEAEKADGDILEVVRRIRDIAGIGVVLSGTENLHGVVSAGRGQFHQIGSRCSFVPPVITGITKEDTAALLEAAFNDEITESNYPSVIDTVHKLAKGSARVVVESFIKAIKLYRSQSIDGISAGFIKQIAEETLKMTVPKETKNA